MKSSGASGQVITHMDRFKSPVEPVLKILQYSNFLQNEILFVPAVEGRFIDRDLSDQ